METMLIITNNGIGISKIKKYSITTRGKRDTPKTLSNNNEKNTPNLAISCAINIFPRRSMIPIFKIKNKIILPIKKTTSRKDVFGINFNKINET